MKISARHSIFVRMTVFVLVVALVPLFTGATVLIRRIEANARERLLESYHWVAQTQVENAERELGEYRMRLQSAAANSYILNMLTGRSGGVYLSGTRISAELTKLLPTENRAEIRNCVLFAMRNVYGNHVTTLTDRERAAWTRDGWTEDSDSFIRTLWNGSSVLALMQPVRYVDLHSWRAENLGYIRLELYPDRLFAPAGNGYDVIVTDDSGAVLYDADVDIGGNGITEEYRLDACGLNVRYVFSERELFTETMGIRRMFYPLAIAAGLLIPLLAVLYFRSYNRRTRHILKRLQRLGEGDLSLGEPLKGRDELAVIDRNLGEMVHSLDMLTQRDQTQREALRAAKLEALRLQINPHFLYNTLETISSLGAVHGAMQVCDLCERLGDMFRYSLGRGEGHYTAVANELKQVENYLFIMRARRPFTQEIVCEIDAEKARMPRFVLQPLVENVFRHASDGLTRELILNITVRREGEVLVIAIADNGTGMTPERLKEIRGNLDRGESPNGIGMTNVGRRVRALCGETAELILESEPGIGTTVFLRLPWLETEPET